VWKAALDRLDDEMQMRLLACNDKLFAYDAKYHKNCLNAYTSE